MAVSSFSIRFLALAGLGVFAVLVAMPGRPQHTVDMPSTTDDRLSAPGWWPTKPGAPVTAFAGDNACGKCHTQELLKQSKNAMTKAAFHGAGGVDSGKPAEGDWENGSYTYRFLPLGSGYSLQVNSGEESLASPVDWTFGAGVHGQTYLLQSKGDIYEGQASSFSWIHKLEMTPGHTPALEGSLQRAIGNRLTSHDAERCFACHSTYWATSGKLDLPNVVTGLHCEACHGPGAAHVRAAEGAAAGVASAKLKQAIFDPGKLSPAASIDFCGACHRTTMDVVLNGTPNGVSNLRFQPYRLQKSPCWLKTEDARLTCTACHNPHGPLVREAASYDANCLSCHTAQAGTVQAKVALGSSQRRPVAHAAVCPKATSQCVTCHMPKYDVPEMHSQFTDHFIRVVRAGEPYPK